MQLIGKLVKNKIVDSALIIACVTAFSYFLTYRYETIYMQYFGAGSDAARVELVPVITVSFLVMSVSTAFCAVLYLIAVSMHRENNMLFMLLKFLGMGVVILVVAVGPSIYMNDPAHFRSHLVSQLVDMGKLILLTAVIVFPFGFVLGLLKSRKRISKVSVNDLKLVIGKTIIHPNLLGYLYVLFCIPTLYFFYAQYFAATTAYNRKDFKVVKEGKTNILILREYTNHLVGVEYNLKTRKFGHNYYYLNLDERSTLTYQVVTQRPNYTSQYLKDLQKQQGRPITPRIDVHEILMTLREKL